MTARQIGVLTHAHGLSQRRRRRDGQMIAAPSIGGQQATETYGQEGSILRFVFWHSLALACLGGPGRPAHGLRASVYGHWWPGQAPPPSL